MVSWVSLCIPLTAHRNLGAEDAHTPGIMEACMLIREQQVCLTHLRHQGPVDNDAGTPVKVQAAAITASLVGIQVDTSRLQ
jgi:hypothetical protein